ncbi:MAG: hypothetical protein QM647_13970 [Asticcacaulis sp.]|uniref:hypothetical protein n=1 Tax=Asticcacaulis sp. TaxID=1872648 RepID=UPI0039E70E56
MYYTWAYTALILGILVSVYALVRGGPAERTGAVMFLVAWLATTLVQGRKFNGIEWGIVAVDSALLVGFVFLALWSRKIWTILIAACQLNAVASHFVPLLAPKFNYVAYLTLVEFWGGYGLLLFLAIGTYSHQRELRLTKAGAAG